MTVHNKPCICCCCGEAEGHYALSSKRNISQQAAKKLFLDVQATFGEQLLEVQQVDQIDTSASVESVNNHLDMLRPAIQSYGGSVEVLAVDDGICEVKYEGPAPIGMGIQAAIKDKFPDIRVVELL